MGTLFGGGGGGGGSAGGTGDISKLNTNGLLRFANPALVTAIKTAQEQQTASQQQATAAPAGFVPIAQAAGQAAAQAAVPAQATPIPVTVIGTLGESPGSTAAATSTTPGSRRRPRAPNRGRQATLLGGDESAEVLGT